MPRYASFSNRPQLVELLLEQPAVQHDRLRTALLRAEKSPGTWQQVSDSISIRMLTPDYSWEARISS